MEQQEVASLACSFIDCVYENLQSMRFGVSCAECDCEHKLSLYRSVKSECKYICYNVPEYTECAPIETLCEFLLTDVTDVTECGVFTLTLA